MTIAVFGSKSFEVSANKIYTMDDLDYSSALNTEKQDSSNGKPSTYNKGPALNSLTFKIVLDVSLGINPRSEIEEWEAIKDAGIAYQFILGGRPIGKYKWLLVDVQASNFTIDNTGIITAAKLSLKFDEYVRAGQVKSISSTSSKSPGITLEDLQSEPVEKTPSEKAGLKRTSSMQELGGWILR